MSLIVKIHASTECEFGASPCRVGRNGAAVIGHGSHGTRSDTLAHLRMLVGAGYGVLAFDARGHGQSAGETNAVSWSGARRAWTPGGTAPWTPAKPAPIQPYRAAGAFGAAARVATLGRSPPPG